MKKCGDFFKLIITTVICLMSGLFSKKDGQAAAVYGGTVNCRWGRWMRRHAVRPMNRGKVIYGVFTGRQAFKPYEACGRINVCGIGCKNRKNGTDYFDTG